MIGLVGWRMGGEMDNRPEEALDRLRTHGWTKGASMNSRGEMCIGGACETGEVGFSPAIQAIATVIRDQFPERVRDAINPSMGIVVRFNDHPDTTFADVERVLEKAAVKWEEERVLRND